MSDGQHMSPVDVLLAEVHALTSGVLKEIEKTIEYAEAHPRQNLGRRIKGIRKNVLLLRVTLNRVHGPTNLTSVPLGQLQGVLEQTRKRIERFAVESVDLSGDTRHREDVFKTFVDSLEAFAERIDACHKLLIVTLPPAEAASAASERKLEGLSEPTGPPPTTGRQVGFKALQQRFVRAVQDAETVSAALRDHASDLARMESISSFARLRDSHRRYEVSYGISVIGALAAAAAAVNIVYNASLTSGADNAEVVAYILHNLLLLSGAGVLVRALLAKYNIERNLRILYDHRLSVLEQYTIFERAITSQNESEKDRLRLEIMKYVFSDPKTGYTSERSADFNFTPIVQVVESLTPKKP